MFQKYPTLCRVLFGLALLAVFAACGKKEEGPLADKGIGPITSVSLGPIDPDRVSKGLQIFQTKCFVCHKLDEKLVGPALKGVTKRRSPEWILNQVLNPTEMAAKDPIAKDLVAQLHTQMTPQGLSEDEARSVLDYLRQVDSQ